MAFMERQVEHGRWIVVDSAAGGCIIPEDVCGAVRDWARHGYAHNPAPLKVWERLRDYVDVSDRRDVFSVETREGWCARLSAPGYLDCTEWSGPYATEQEAEAALTEMYGEDEDEDEDATEKE